jgi:hypothetical protein
MIHPRRNPLTYVALTAAALLATGHQRARADERATLTVGATIAVGVVSSLIAAWIWDEATDDDNPECTGAVIVDHGKAEVKKADGTTITVEGEHGKIPLEGEGDGASSTYTVTLPGDYGIALPPTYVMQETQTYTADFGTGQFQLGVDDSTLYADVSAPAFTGTESEWLVERGAKFRLVKPPGAPAGDAVLSIPVDISSLVLTTTNFPKTVASVESLWTIEAEELGGIVWSSRVVVPQGGTPVVQGDIPAGAWSLSAGVASLSSYSNTFTINVPEAIDGITFRVRMSQRGHAYELQTPPWATLNYTKASGSGSAKLIGSGSMVPSTTSSFAVRDCLPTTAGILFVSNTAAPAPAFGGVFVPLPVLVELALRTNGAGELTVPFTVPALPTGATLVMQYWFPDPLATQGIAGTNALVGVVP